MRRRLNSKILPMAAADQGLQRRLFLRRNFYMFQSCRETIKEAKIGLTLAVVECAEEWFAVG
jgi:hypothetical protein